MGCLRLAPAVHAAAACGGNALYLLQPSIRLQLSLKYILKAVCIMTPSHDKHSQALHVNKPNVHDVTDRLVVRPQGLLHHDTRL